MAANGHTRYPKMAKVHVKPSEVHPKTSKDGRRSPKCLQRFPTLWEGLQIFFRRFSKEDKGPTAKVIIIIIYYIAETVNSLLNYYYII